MNTFIEISKRLIPDIFEIIEKRYNILRAIEYNEPVGRRGISNILNLSERNIRTEIELLKKENLISIENNGMKITEEGKNTVRALSDYIYEIKGMSAIAEQVQSLLKVKKVLVVPGNTDSDAKVLKDIGKRASELLLKSLKRGFVIGVTGGTTVMELANELEPNRKHKDVLVLPARGGLGERLETQANNIAAMVAKKLSASYKLFHLPDNLDIEIISSLMKLEDIKSIMEYMKHLDLLVFGIGSAREMAETRKLSEKVKQKLNQENAVSEAFGHFFDIEGNLIYEISTFGIRLEDFRTMKNLIGVAGGANKAEAIISVSRLNSEMHLVLDQGAAERIIEIFNQVKI